MLSVSITMKVVSLSTVYVKVYSIQLYGIKFLGGLQYFDSLVQN